MISEIDTSHTDHMPTGPRTGIRVIALGQIAAGSFLWSRFADLGAKVIKIECPDGVVDMRRWPRLTGESDGVLLGET